MWGWLLTRTRRPPLRPIDWVIGLLVISALILIGYTCQ